MRKCTCDPFGHVAGFASRLIVVVIFTLMIIPGASAQGTGNTFFNDWNVVQTGGGVHIDLPPPVVLPATIPVTIVSRGSYSGPCPVGTSGAPLLLNPNMQSKALCRGACGPDCPTGRCTPQKEITGIPSPDGSGTCTYRNVISCPTHEGCQEHDSCYDWCESHGYTSVIDGCHLQCNQRCYDKYGRGSCTPWADLPGRVGATKPADWMVNPRYSANNLLFSDPPEFIPNKAPITSPATTQPTVPTLTPTVLPTTVPTILPVSSPVPSSVPTPPVTTSPPKGVQEPDVSLTILYTGGAGGTVASDVPAQASCSPAQGDGKVQCGAKFRYGTTVSLIAIPQEGARLVGWYGACSGTGVCTVVMNRDKTVTAQFEPMPVTRAITSYQDYCTENYPGSVYNAADGTCEYRRTGETSGGGNKPTLIPLTGDCCAGESCRTKIADAQGGSPPYHFSSGSYAGGGAPPMGMGIGLDGYLTGTAPSVGTYRFSVCVTDLAGNYDCGVSTVVIT